jgi:AraC-like DNA-binding protein
MPGAAAGEERGGSMTDEMSDQGFEPLREFPLLRSRDPHEARDVMRRYGVDIIATNSDGFFFRTNLAELPHVGLYFACNAAPIRLEIPERAVALVHLCLRGHARVTTGAHHVELSEGAAVVCPPRCRTQLEFGQDCRQLVLRIPQRMLERTVAALIGFTPQQPIAFEPAIAQSDPRYLGFRDLMTLLAWRLDSNFSIWPNNVLLQLEQTCITALLHCSRHNLRHLLDETPGEQMPPYLLEAEHYAEGRCEDDIGVDDMARAAGVSVSTLSRAFLRHRGYSPSAFIKRARLSRAKTLLETGAASTVVGVALRCGFTNPSRFAQEYREAFGESPTETLRRRRPSAAPEMQKD